MRHAPSPNPSISKKAFMVDRHGVQYRFQVLHAEIQPRGRDLVYAFVNDRRQVGYVGSTEDASLRFPHERLDEFLCWGATRLWVSRPVYRSSLPLHEVEGRLIEAYRPPLNAMPAVPMLPAPTRYLLGAPALSDHAYYAPLHRQARRPPVNAYAEAMSERTSSLAPRRGGVPREAPRQRPLKFRSGDDEAALETLERIAKAFDRYRR
jgi:hypothetical protein